MGFPKVLASRLRYAKGTRFYYYRDYAAFAGLLVVSAIGLCFRYSDYIQDFRSEYEKGEYANSPEFEMRRITMGLGPFTSITNSQDILKHQDEEKNFISDFVKVGDIKK